MFNDALPANAQMLNLALWTPTLEHYEQAGIFLNGSPQFATDFARELDKSGYPAESFAPFFEAYAQWQAQALAQGYSAQSFEALIGGLQTALPGPAGNLIGGTAEAKFFLSAGSMEGGAEATLTAGTFKLDTLYSLSGIFSRYRENALALSLYGLLVITGGCLIVYKPKRGAMVLLVPLLAGLATLGTLGYVHSALNLFHVIGMFLGVCLALDYGAFALRNRGGASVPYSVCVAAATSVSAFALLALSRIAAVTALGLTVTLCIAYAFIFVVLLTIPTRSKTR